MSSILFRVLVFLAALAPWAFGGTTIVENSRHDMAAGDFGIAWIFGGNVMRGTGDAAPATLLSGVNATKIIGADVNGDGHQELVYLGAGGSLYYYDFQNGQTAGPFGTSFLDLTAGAFRSGEVRDFVVLTTGSLLVAFDGSTGGLSTFPVTNYRSLSRGNYNADNAVDEFMVLTATNAASMLTPNGTGGVLSASNKGSNVAALVAGNLTAAAGDETWQLSTANAVTYNENVTTTNTSNATGLTGGAGLALATGNFNGVGLREGGVVGSDGRISLYIPGTGAITPTTNNSDFVTLIFADFDNDGTDELFAIKSGDRSQLWRYDVQREAGFTAFGATSPLVSGSQKTILTGSANSGFPDFAAGAFLSGTIGSTLKVANLNGVAGSLNGSVVVEACGTGGLSWLQILNNPLSVSAISSSFTGPADFALRNAIVNTAFRSTSAWSLRFAGLTPGARYRLQLLTSDGFSGVNQRNFDVFVGTTQVFDDFQPPRAGLAPYAGIGQFEILAAADGTTTIQLLPGNAGVSTDTAPQVNAVAIAQIDTNPPPPGVVSINEFMASNSTGLTDVDGDHSDWIEIYNGGDAPANLAGWALTDDPDKLDKWVFPAVTVPARGFLVVFASGKDRTTVPLELHTNFSLSSGGEYLALVNPAGQVVCAWSPTFPEQFANQSYGPSRPVTAAEPPGSAAFAALQRTFSVPTPGATNYTNPEVPRVASITASVERGVYTTAQSVTLSTPTAGAAIYYTFDGSTPSPSSITAGLYSGPIPITKTTTLRYVGTKANAISTPVVTQTYVFPADVKNQSPNSISAGGANPVITNPPGAAQPSTAWLRGTLSNSYYRASTNQILDYGMDTRVVSSATYGPQLERSLTAIPTFSLVTDLDNLFGSSGIYVNPRNDGITAERLASLELVYPDGTKGFQINCGVRIRGGASRDENNPKHAFRFFFRSEYGEPKLKYPIFGDDPTATDTFDKFDLRCAQNYSWSYNGDTGNIFIPDEFARLSQLAMGQVSSHSMHAHLYVNGQYWGLFNLDERPEANFGATYFGGDDDDYDTIKVAPEDAKNVAADGNFNAWMAFWTLADQMNAGTGNATFQKMMGRNPDGTPNAAFPVYLDPVNLADYMVAIYWTGNLDAAVSNFFGNDRGNNWFGVRDRTGTHGGFRFILHDSEHILRNVNENRLGPSAGQGWRAGDSVQQGATTAFNGSTPQYICTQLLKYSTDFKALWSDRVYRHLFNGGALTTANTQARFDFLKAEILDATIAESARWGDSKRSTPALQSDFISSFAGYRNGFLVTRTPIFISQLQTWGWYPSLQPANWSQRGGAVLPGSTVTLTNPNGSGTIYYTVNGSDPRALGGGVSVSATAYSAPIPITSSVTIRTRIYNGSTWSALDEATFYVQQDFTKLIVSEINYAPLPNGGTNGDEFEFLEFKNIGGVALDLGGLSFSSGITYTFPTGTSLQPGGFYVLARNAAQFANRYPGVTVNGLYTGKLDNSGESLTIFHPLGGVVLDFAYKDSAPWPVTADGSGFSLVSKNPATHTAPGNPALWRASTNVGGSPGADDPPNSIPAVVINEILTNSTAPTTDYVELFNPGAAPADISYWWLSDASGHLQKYQFPAGTIIPAGGYLTVTEAQFNPTPGVGNSFSFSSDGEEAYLSSGNAAGALTGYSHGVDFQAADPQVSFGRYVNSVGTESFPAQNTRTPGSANSGPRAGPVVINEIQYHPLPDYDEYLELKNLTGVPVSLWDPALPANTWRIDGLDFNFPANATIPANGFALVVNLDPVVFRAKYQIPASVPIYGPYTGAIDNNGERLVLEKPGTPSQDNTGLTVIPYVEIDNVRYGNAAPWPTAADGAGPSLQRLVSAGYGDEPTNWFASGITPGRENTLNQAPTCVLASPASGATFNLPTTITLVANAADSDGFIAKVEFYDGSTKIGESTTAPYTFSWSTAAAGAHLISARAIDSSLAITTSAGVTIQVNGSSIGGNGTGLRGDYYNDPNADTHFDGAIYASLIAPQINFSENGTESPSQWPRLIVPSFPDNNTFSVRYSGQLLPASTSTYNFYTTSDDGVRLYINGQLVIGNWTIHGPTVNVGSIALQAGQLYDIVLEFYENDGGAQITLEYEATGVGIGRQLIPASRMYPTGSPIIISQPAPLTLNTGNTVTFAVLAAGGNLTYQWQFNNADIPGATGASLVIQDPLLTHAGPYRVRITNSYGSVFSNPATLTIPDTDADGLPNYWETLNGLSNSINDAALDSDSDGYSNAAEFQAGTNPFNPASRPTTTIGKVSGSGGGFTVSFQAQSNRAYTVQYKDAFAAPTWQTLQQIPAAFAPRTITITDSAIQTQRYYRVITPQQ